LDHRANFTGALIFEQKWNHRRDTTETVYQRLARRFHRAIASDEVLNAEKRITDGVVFAERVTAHARKRGLAPATLAVAWVMSHPTITAPIIGARSVEQLQGSLAALDVKMTPEWRVEVSALSIEPPPATDRLEEKFGG
jgi:aryl-alcohol dehydrogenase-like predicted oxidoreductase